MNTKVGRAEQAALAHLERVAVDAHAREVERLPTLAALARDAHVAPSTMQKAVATLRSRCVLTTSEGKGIRLLRLPPAQRAALDYLFEQVAAHRESGAPRLPTVAKLAEAAGVSLVTMSRAVARLRDAGVVRTRHGKGIHLAEEEADGSREKTRRRRQVPRLGTKWERVARQLRTDILARTYPPGTHLPSAKELTSRYGVCHKTLGKALKVLLDEGRLSLDRTKYVVPAPTGGRHRNTIVLIARGTPRGELFKLSVRTITNLRMLENACSANRLKLVVATRNDKGNLLLGPDRRTMSFAEAIRRETVLGFVVWTMALDGFDLDGLLFELAEHRRPIAILDEGSNYRIPARLRAPIKMFQPVIGRGASREVARLLLNLGHRTVAYISHVGDAGWSQERLAGLREEFAKAGVGDSERAVVEVSSDSPARVPFRRQQSDTLATFWEYSQYVELLKEREWVRESTSQGFTEGTIRMLRQQFHQVRQDQVIRDAVFPLFDRAVQYRDVTAWVGASDEVALQALEFLQLKGRRVPEDFSVVGFDNSVDATVRGVTSYNFNSSAHMHALITHILDPHRDPWDPRSDEPIRIQGFINERITTARARASSPGDGKDR